MELATPRRQRRGHGKAKATNTRVVEVTVTVHPFDEVTNCVERTFNNVMPIALPKPHAFTGAHLGTLATGEVETWRCEHIAKHATTNTVRFKLKRTDITASDGLTLQFGYITSADDDPMVSKANPERNMFGDAHIPIHALQTAFDTKTPITAAFLTSKFDDTPFDYTVEVKEMPADLNLSVATAAHVLAHAKYFETWHENIRMSESSLAFALNTPQPALLGFVNVSDSGVPPSMSAMRQNMVMTEPYFLQLAEFGLGEAQCTAEEFIADVLFIQSLAVNDTSTSDLTTLRPIALQRLSRCERVVNCMKHRATMTSHYNPDLDRVAMFIELHTANGTVVYQKVVQLRGTERRGMSLTNAKRDCESMAFEIIAAGHAIASIERRVVGTKTDSVASRLIDSIIYIASSQNMHVIYGVAKAGRQKAIDMHDAIVQAHGAPAACINEKHFMTGMLAGHATAWQTNMRCTTQIKAALDIDGGEMSMEQLSSADILAQQVEHTNNQATIMQLQREHATRMTPTAAESAAGIAYENGYERIAALYAMIPDLNCQYEGTAVSQLSAISDANECSKRMRVIQNNIARTYALPSEELRVYVKQTLGALHLQLPIEAVEHPAFDSNDPNYITQELTFFIDGCMIAGGMSECGLAVGNVVDSEFSASACVADMNNHGTFAILNAGGKRNSHTMDEIVGDVRITACPPHYLRCTSGTPPPIAASLLQLQQMVRAAPDYSEVGTKILFCTDNYQLGAYPTTSPMAHLNELMTGVFTQVARNLTFFEVKMEPGLNGNWAAIAHGIVRATPRSDAPVPVAVAAVPRVAFRAPSAQPTARFQYPRGREPRGLQQELAARSGPRSQTNPVRDVSPEPSTEWW